MAAKQWAESLLALDVFGFRREGKIVANAERVVLRVDGEHVVAVPLAWQPANLGGSYPWFVCPACSARRRILRVKDGRVACAPCHGVRYRSRHERWSSSQVLRRARRLRARLDADGRLFGDLPPRPRHHMAAVWYDRIVAEIRICEGEAASALAATLERRKAKP